MKYFKNEDFMNTKIDHSTFEFDKKELKSIPLDLLTLLVLLSVYCYLYYTYLQTLKIIRTFRIIDKEFSEDDEHKTFLKESKLEQFNWIYNLYNYIQQTGFYITIDKTIDKLKNIFSNDHIIFQLCPEYNNIDIKSIKSKDERVNQIYQVKSQILKNYMLYHIVFPIIF